MMNDSMFKIWQIKLIIQRDVDKGSRISRGWSSHALEKDEVYCLSKREFCLYFGFWVLPGLVPSHRSFRSVHRFNGFFHVCSVVTCSFWLEVWLSWVELILDPGCVKRCWIRNPLTNRKVFSQRLSVVNQVFHQICEGYSRWFRSS